MDGKRQRIELSKVSPKSVRSAMSKRAGLNQGLCHHRRDQVEGVEGPMGKVPQVVARKGGMPAPCTRLQHLVDSEVLLEKKRRSNTASLPSSKGRNRLFRTRELVGT